MKAWGTSPVLLFWLEFIFNGCEEFSAIFVTARQRRERASHLEIYNTRYKHEKNEPRLAVP